MTTNDYDYVDIHPRSLPAIELTPLQPVDPEDPSYANLAKAQLFTSIWRFSVIPDFKRLFNSSTKEFAGASLHARCAEILNDLQPRHDILVSQIRVL